MINVFKFKLELVFELERVIVSNEVMKEDQIKVSGLVPYNLSVKFSLQGRVGVSTSAHCLLSLCNGSSVFARVPSNRPDFFT